MSKALEPAQIELSAIVVSYNTRAMTLSCLRALEAELVGRSAEIIVVDNASNDGSAQAIANEFPQVQMIANSKNLGFGAANNQAFRMARGQFFLLINSDARLSRGSVEALLTSLRADSRIAVSGPKTLKPDGSLQVSCYFFPSPWRSWVEALGLARLLPTGSKWGNFARWAHNEERDVDFVIGACLLVRREAFDQVGGFDERFFLYAEETDWLLRLRSRGWRVRFTPLAEVIHVGGASGEKKAGHPNPHFFRSLDLYYLKHFGKAGFLSYRLSMIVGQSARWLLWEILACFGKGLGRVRAKERAHFCRALALRELSLWDLSYPQNDGKAA